MTDFSAPNTDAAQNSAPSKQSLSKSIKTEEALIATLIVLSIAGIAITNFSPFESYYFWLAMVPVFGLTSLYIGWSKARKRGEGITRIIWVQLLHWVGLLAAIGLIYLLYYTTGRIDNNQLALLTLITLSLATFLAGVHFDWRFIVVGIVLGAAVAGAAFVEQIIWMITIPIAALILLAVFWWKRSL